MLAKDEPDCEASDQVSESNYDDGHHETYKSSLSGIKDDVDSDNEASNDQHPLRHPLEHHFRSSGVKLEAALIEFSEGLNLINKPNSNTNDDNNNTSSSYNSATTSNNDNNNNNTHKGDGANKMPRKLFECDVCNVSCLEHLFMNLPEADPTIKIAIDPLIGWLTLKETISSMFSLLYFSTGWIFLFSSFSFQFHFASSL